MGALGTFRDVVVKRVLWGVPIRDSFAKRT